MLGFRDMAELCASDGVVFSSELPIFSVEMSTLSLVVKDRSQ